MKVMKKITLSALALGALVATNAMSAEVLSLRGEQELASDSTEFTRKDPISVSGGMERTWKLQPPVIPHGIDKDRITLRENTCLSCHSEETYKKEKSPKIGDSHYVDAEGKVLTEMNMRRYFCNQCHVQQMDANPLVENLFVGDKRAGQ